MDLNYSGTEIYIALIITAGLFLRYLMIGALLYVGYRVIKRDIKRFRTPKEKK